MFQVAIIQTDDTTGQIVTIHKTAEVRSQLISIIERDAGMFSKKDSIKDLVGSAMDEIEREMALRTVGVEPTLA